MVADGHNVIPNVRLSGRNSVPYALAECPYVQRSPSAIWLHKVAENRPCVIEEIRIICDTCMPTSLVVYGSDAYGVLGENTASARHSSSCLRTRQLPPVFV